MTKLYPGKTIPQVLKLTTGKAIDRISLSTINTNLTHLSHLFTWCMAKPRRYLTENPVDGLFFEDVEAVSYETYMDADLKTLFSSPDFTKQRESDPPRYWLPLLLAYSGCRREELADLSVSDIKTEGGITYFDLVPDATRGRRLKTKSSRRVVPVHSALVTLGFPQYVTARLLASTERVSRASGGRQTASSASTDLAVEASRASSLATVGALLLFSKGNGKGRATVGDSVSKWWRRLLASHSITGKKTLHSFRPTVTTRLHAAGVDGETRRQLLGHAGLDVHETVYLRPSLAVLKAAIEKLQYPL